MFARQVKVFKKDQINIEGAVQIAPFTGAEKGSALHADTSGPARQARIVKSNGDFAILEVVCGCGCKSHVQCYYANA